MLTNINGLLNKLSEIEQYIDQNRPTIVALVETHLTENILEKEYQIQGYKSINVFSSSIHTGGCSFYIRDDVKIYYQQQSIIDKKIWINSVKLKIVNKDILIHLIYRSPSYSCNEFCDYFNNWIEKNNKIKLDTSILGDFNIDT